MTIAKLEKLTSTEIMALQYLADSPEGRNMVSEPNLARALKSIAKFEPWALKEFSKSPQDGDNSVIAGISNEARDMLLKQNEAGQ
ncbi:MULTISPECIES: hypothetical protein [unclassified Phyllobacterium]|uniref:hypothetical protein n=1 Tax=unclassified Phyllobacterium TaxID=2638441 RepID=UPI0030130B82